MGINKERSIAIIGLGYVGLPLAVEFSKKYQVVGFDNDKQRILDLKSGNDKTLEISKNELKSLKNLNLTFNEKEIYHCNIFIVTVPTPVDRFNSPDLSALSSASALVGNALKKDDIVIYESTVFPGATEEFCIPILEKESKLNYNVDFFCGYSPERINPGDKDHSLTAITKITSGSNQQTADFVDSLYRSIIKAGTHKAPSISVAEAAKVIENVQRDVNIALINELSMIFNIMKIDTKDVLEAASSKWNFLPFSPGLVGGHCIGVDPYYLTYKAIEIGYNPEIILAGRRLNDSMGEFIANITISNLTKLNINPIGARIGILGLTFKENCPDLRNTKVASIIESLKKHNCKIQVTDEFCDINEAKNHYNINLVDLNKMNNLDAIILAVSHSSYLSIPLQKWEEVFDNQGVFIDVKSVYPKHFFEKSNIIHWRL